MGTWDSTTTQHLILSSGCTTGKSATTRCSLKETNLESNIDRILAIWQVLNPDSWFDGYYQDLARPTYVARQGTREDESTHLYPFAKATDPRGPRHWTYWESRDLREVAALGYTYTQIPTDAEAHEHPKRKRRARKPRPVDRRFDEEDDEDTRRRMWATREINEHLEWATIGGVPDLYHDPGHRPVLSLGHASYRKIECLPDHLKVDERYALRHVEFVERPRGRFRKLWHHATGWCLEKLPGGVPQRYRHIKGLVHDGKMYQWNATVRVEK